MLRNLRKRRRGGNRLRLSRQLYGLMPSSPLPAALVNRGHRHRLRFRRG
jgi:hypothetical protein